MGKMVSGPGTRSTVSEGASEVREKLRSDLSRLMRVRRFATLKPTMGCIACDATGKIVCAICGGTGKSKLVLDDRQEDCAHCDGTGRVTCVQCAGRGQVANVHRKKVLWLLVIGGLAWGYVLFRLWNRDILPDFRAQGGGRQISRPAPNRPATPGISAPSATGGNMEVAPGGMAPMPGGVR